jgi:hypothetical protein
MLEEEAQHLPRRVLDDMMLEVSGSPCPSARLHSRGIPAIGSPQTREMGMILADPAAAETIGKVGFTAAPKRAGPPPNIAEIPRAIGKGLWTWAATGKCADIPLVPRMSSTRSGPTGLNNSQLGVLAREDGDPA